MKDPLYHTCTPWRIALLGMLCLLLAPALLQAQDYFYYYKGRKMPLQLNTGYVYVVATPAFASREALEKALGSDVVVSRFASETTGAGLKGVQQTSTTYWAEIKLSKPLPEADYWKYIASLRARQVASIASPYFSNEADAKLGLSQYFYVKLKREDDYKVLAAMAKETQTAIVGQNNFMPLWYTLSATSLSGHALAMANRFYESGRFAAAEADLMSDEDAFAANDPFYASQWGLNNTGLYGGTVGLDVNAEAAWTITKGSRDVIVAVLDQGIEMNHPDLAGNIFGTGYDTESGTSPAQVLGSHGTACAGIIGAIQDNNIGVSGIAPAVRLMSVSNSLAGTPNSRQKRADGINWAWQHGAAVISNSWGSGVQYQVIDDAITDALNLGRNGLGTVIVFASGNNNGAVSYPANSNPSIVVVGAMSECGQRKSPSSCDGENWGGNFGATLDIAAPGVLVPTTDRQGTNGYNPNQPIHSGPWLSNDFADNNYTVWFNGTSSATPMVAGVAALILSVNPCLTHGQVEAILEQSAQKVGSYMYSNTAGRPNGTWNNEMGYGLVDAFAAVQLAQGQLPTLAGFNLMTKDRPFDVGAEPNPDSGPMWISEDIWVRQQLDGGTAHQNPEYKMYSPNGLYIKVTNIGGQTSPCANLSAYFSKASTGLVWPTHWNSYFQNTSSGSILHGDKINTVLVPPLAPGASYVAEIPWFPPNPANFDNEIHHFCLLSRIQSPGDPMFNEQNFIGVNSNVRNNNNIAWKNVSVYDNDANLAEASVFIRGVQEGLSNVNIRFVDTGFKEEIKVKFFDRGGVIRMRVDERLAERLNKAELVEVRWVDKYILEIASPKAQILKLPIYSKETFSMSFAFKVDLAEGEETVLDVVQVNADKRNLEGGERFVIGYGKRGLIAPKKAVTLSYPNPAEGELYVKFAVEEKTADVQVSVQSLDGARREVLLKEARVNGQHVEKLAVQHLPNGIYILEVKVGGRVMTERVVIRR